MTVSWFALTTFLEKMEVIWKVLNFKLKLFNRVILFGEGGFLGNQSFF